MSWLGTVIKISSQLALFHEVPTGAIEMLVDEQHQPRFKRAGTGQYLGIKNIKFNFNFNCLNWYFVAWKDARQPLRK